jgi:hypothetical protein
MRGVPKTEHENLDECKTHPQPPSTDTLLPQETKRSKPDKQKGVSEHVKQKGIYKSPTTKHATSQSFQGSAEQQPLTLAPSTPPFGFVSHSPFQPAYATLGSCLAKDDMAVLNQELHSHILRMHIRHFPLKAMVAHDGGCKHDSQVLG